MSKEQPDIERALQKAQPDVDPSRPEDALRKSERMFRALVEAASYSIYSMSADWTEMRQLEGRGFLIDRVSSDSNWMQTYILPEDQPAVTRAIANAIQNRSLFQMEHRVRQADGSIG